MKWQHGLLLLASLIICYLLWQNWIKNQLINQLQTQDLEKIADTIEIQTTKSVVEHRDRIKTNTKIVDKWNNIHDTILQRDTLLVEAKKDIQYLDTSLIFCSKSLDNCLEYSKAQKELIKALEGKKTPLIVPTISVGLSMNKELIVQPAVSAGVGLNLNKIFGKK